MTDIDLWQYMTHVQPVTNTVYLHWYELFINFPNERTFLNLWI